MNWERKHKRSITFTGKDGRFAGKVKVGECGKRGNRHFNARRPDGPVCGDCGAPWAPICPTFTCPGSKVPRQMIRSEKQDAGTKRFPGHPMFKPRPVHDTPRRESPTKAARPTVLDGKLKALEAKYGGRHERRRAA